MRVAQVSRVCGLLLAISLAQVAHAQQDSAGVAILSPSAVRPMQVSAGADLAIDVRLRTALTPPPGIQQPRALRDWSVELVCARQAWGTTREQRYRLAVINVRPISGHSLDYRAHVPLPAWIAPGLYELNLSAPGGETSAVDAVRVHDPRIAPNTQVVWLEAGQALPPRAADVTWFPASTVGLSTQRPQVIGFARGAPMPEPIRVSAPNLTVRRASEVRAGGEGELWVEGAPSQARVAWMLADGTSAWGGPRLRHRFQGSGETSGAVMVIGPDGGFATATFALQVAPGHRFGCGLGGHVADLWTWGALIVGCALLKRRPRRRAGISSPP